MKLNSDEAQLLKKVRSKYSAWRRHRWYCLFAGLFSAMGGAWLLLESRKRTIVLDKWSGEILWAVPAFWWLLLQGAWLLTFTASRWRGDPLSRLALKLFDEVETPLGEGDGKEAAGSR